MKRLPNKLRIALLVLGPTVIALCLVCTIGYVVLRDAFAGIGDLVSDEGCLEGDGWPDDRTALEQWAGLILPPSATNIQGRSTMTLQSCHVFVSFDMDAEDREVLLASTRFTDVHPATAAELADFPRLVAYITPQWTLPTGDAYWYGEAFTQSAAHHLLLVQTGAQYTVYAVNLLD